MTSDLITKILFSAFTVIYALAFVRSLFRGEILFRQGLGSSLNDDRKKFIRYAFYHGVIVFIFSAITIGMWIAL